jgi:hypothetical protein
MTQIPRPGEAAPEPARDDAISVISAYGAFRIVLVLLAIWSFFAGFSLLTSGFGALSFGGDRASERLIGAQMLVLAPVYGLLAWRRRQYRLLLWVPYAAQAAIVVPTLWDILITRDRDFDDGTLPFLVSLTFLVLLVYFWRSSHPLDFFAPDEEEYDEEDELVDEEDGEEWDEEDEEDEEDEDDEIDEEIDEEVDEEPEPPPRRTRRR